MKPSLCLATLVVALLGCGDDDDDAVADVQGTYTLNVTNGPSSCPLTDWNQGATTSGIPLTVTQNGSSVSADVGGAGAIFLNVYCGNAHLEGSVSGMELDLTLQGSRSHSSGTCAFTIDAQLVATVNNDTISGSITYTPDTNSSADCVPVRACSARMNFNGTRPPSGD
jgi:hypothetical protein